MTGPSENLAIAKRYLKAIESGAKSDLAAVRASADCGKQVMSSQRYETKNELAIGDQVVLEVDWTGILAVPFQTIPKGGQMRAHFAMFLQFKDGKLLAQRNYDCYEAS